MPTTSTRVLQLWDAHYYAQKVHIYMFLHASTFNFRCWNPIVYYRSSFEDSQLAFEDLKKEIEDGIVSF